MKIGNAQSVPFFHVEQRVEGQSPRTQTFVRRSSVLNLARRCGASYDECKSDRVKKSRREK